MRRPFGRTLIAAGDNPDGRPLLRHAAVVGPRPGPSCCPRCRPPWPGSCSSGTPACTPPSAHGYEFAAITAVVLGGVVLGGGRGWVLSAAAGAFALELLFTLLTFLGRPVDLAGHRPGRHHHRRRRRCRRAPGSVGRRRDSTAPTDHPPHRTPHEPDTHQPARARTQERTDARSHHGRRSRPPQLAVLTWRAAAPTSRTDRRPAADRRGERRRRHAAASGSSRRTYDEQDQQRSATFEGDPKQPWLQYIDGEMTDTVEVRRPTAPRRSASPTPRSATRGARPAGSP